MVGAGNTYVVNTEGTRLRTADTGALLLITAEIQAEDGMRISSGLNYYDLTPDRLPAAGKIEADIDELVSTLTEARCIGNNSVARGYSRLRHKDEVLSSIQFGDVWEYACKSAE